MSRKSSPLLLLLLLALPGCKAPDLLFSQPPVVIQNPNPAVPLAAVLLLQVDQPCRIIASISDGTHRWQQTFESSGAGPGRFPLIGMRPGRQHTIELQLEQNGKQTAYPEPLYFTPPALPGDPAEFPRITIHGSQPAEMEPGFTLFNPRRRAEGSGQNRFNQSFGMLAAVDSAGEVVWYYRSDSRISDFNYLANGHILYMTQDFTLVEIDLLGNVQRTWYAADRPYGPLPGAIPVQCLNFHHDAYPLPNGNILVLSSEIKTIENYYTSEEEANAPRKAQQVMGDVIVEFAPDGKIVWQWHAFDHLDPMRIGYETFSQYWERRGFPGVIDWSHANSVYYDEKDDAVLVNFRYLSSILKIDKATGQIKWLFGEPTGLAPKLQARSIRLRNAPWLWHQHSPSPTPNGTWLIFNNANYQAWPFDPPIDNRESDSYAAEYRMDEPARTAERIWSARIPGEPKVASIAMGDVDWLPAKGNVLVSYGFLLPNEAFVQRQAWTMVREYARTDPPRLLWEMRLSALTEDTPVGWTIFSAERVDLKIE